MFHIVLAYKYSTTAHIYICHKFKKLNFGVMMMCNDLMWT